ncbi:MAG TPA: YciI family protein [Actinomycetota bacterium]|nr:YciI family protein [Actinomycetota bacterium]
MRYLLLLADEPGADDVLSPDQKMRIARAHLALVEELRGDGRLVASAALDPAGAGVVAPPSADVVADGPFAETKEVLGSFYVVEADDDDHARALAARMPPSPGLRVLVIRTADV